MIRFKDACDLVVLLAMLGGFIFIGVLICIRFNQMDKIDKKEPIPAEPVVCIVKLQSGPIGTHNFKGVVK